MHLHDLLLVGLPVIMAHGHLVGDVPESGPKGVYGVGPEEEMDEDHQGLLGAPQRQQMETTVTRFPAAQWGSGSLRTEHQQWAHGQHFIPAITSTPASHPTPSHSPRR